MYFFLSQVRALHPHTVHSCEQLRKHLKTIPPNRDIEAKAVILLIPTNEFVVFFIKCVLLFYLYSLLHYSLHKM